MRLFVGIPLKGEVIDQLSAVSAKLKSSHDGLRWSAPESWHITLQFLGNTSEEKYQCVAAQLREVHSPAVPIQLAGLDCFDRAGVLLAAVTRTTGLVTLEQYVTMATGLCGFAAETRPYHPHITLARSKGAGRGRELRDLKSRVRDQPKFTRFVAPEFVLYESFLGSAGARYEIREQFALQGLPQATTASASGSSN